MKESIVELYNRESSYAEDIIPKSKEYNKLRKEVSEVENKFKESLDSIQRETFENYITEYYRIMSIESEENFKEGFSLGVRLTAEAFIQEK